MVHLEKIWTALSTSATFCHDSDSKMPKARSFFLGKLADKNETTSVLKSKSQDDPGNTDLDVDNDKEDFDDASATNWKFGWGLNSKQASLAQLILHCIIYVSVEIIYIVNNTFLLCKLQFYR